MPNDHIPFYSFHEDIDDEQDNEPAAALIVLGVIVLATAVVLYGRLFLQWVCG